MTSGSQSMLALPLRAEISCDAVAVSGVGKTGGFTPACVKYCSEIFCSLCFKLIRRKDISENPVLPAKSLPSQLG